MLGNGTRPSLRAAASGALWAATAFLLVSGSLSSLSQAFGAPPYIPILSPKLRHLQQDGAGYDLVFVGDSRTFRGIDPKTLDAELAARGCPARSFNAGVDGLNAIELTYLLEQLSQRSGRIPHLLIQDLRPVDPSMANLRSRRQAYFARLDHLALAFRSIAASDLSAFEKLESSAKVLIATLYSHLGVGQIAQLWGQGSPAPAGDSERSTRNAGFAALDGEPAGDGPIQQRRREFLRDHERREAQFQILRELDFAASPAPLPAGYEDLLLELLVSARQAGIHVGLYVMPRARDPLVALQGHRLERAWADSRPEIPVLNFHDPERFPEIYASENWWDTGHLNERGAELFNRSIAGPLCAWLRGQRG